MRTDSAERDHHPINTMSNFRVHSNHPYTDIRGIVQTIEEKGNLFAEDSKELHAIHTEIIMPAEVVESIMSAESKGQDV